MEVDCVRFLLHEAVSTSGRGSGRATFAGLELGKMGQEALRRGGAGLTMGVLQAVC